MTDTWATPPAGKEASTQEAHEGLMRVWDPEQKKVIFVTAEPVGDWLTLTVRLHDPKERVNHKLSASWATRRIPRADLQLSKSDFLAKHFAPVLDEIEHFKPKP